MVPYSVIITQTLILTQNLIYLQNANVTSAIVKEIIVHKKALMVIFNDNVLK